MTKKEKKVMEGYCIEYHIDPRTTGMIVHHYIDCGEREISKLTLVKIDEVCDALKKQEAEAQAKGKIMLITPEFTKYILLACYGLYKIDESVRYKIIKEWLR